MTDPATAFAYNLERTGAQAVELGGPEIAGPALGPWGMPFLRRLQAGLPSRGVLHSVRYSSTTWIVDDMSRPWV